MVTQLVPIQSLANQQFTITLDGTNWDFTIKACAGVMAVSIKRDGVEVVTGLRAVAGMRLIPARYQEAGNFVFYTSNFELPDWRQFNISQSLIYYSAAELEAIRRPTPPRITAAYFNAIAPLPLRFKPVGYT